MRHLSLSGAVLIMRVALKAPEKEAYVDFSMP